MSGAAPREKPLKLNATGKYDRIPDDLKQSQSSPESELVPCPQCGRKFAPDRIERHKEVCMKLSSGSERRGKFAVH